MKIFFYLSLNGVCRFVSYKGDEANLQTKFSFELLLLFCKRRFNYTLNVNMKQLEVPTSAKAKRRISQNISENESKFVDPPCNSVLLQYIMGSFLARTTPGH